MKLLQACDKGFFPQSETGAKTQWTLKADSKKKEKRGGHLEWFQLSN